jgi:DNA-binding transcriptional regulator GbsR (MarR family)
MSNIQQIDTLLQLKIDYIKYMEQVLLFGTDEKQKGIILALLLEKSLGNDYLTHDQLMELTGFSRKIVSETLSELIKVQNRLHIIKTRKPRDPKNYYTCPYNFEQYTKSMFLESFKITRINLKFLPSIIKRLNALSPETDDIIHARRFLNYFLIANESFGYFIDRASEENLDKYFESSQEDNELLKHIHNLNPEELLNEQLKKSDSTAITGDSLLQIKRDFIFKMIENLPASTVESSAALAIYFVIYLEREPVHQERIKKILGYSRSTISDSLAIYIRVKVIKEIKKPGDRKKYYLPLINPVDMNFQKVLGMRRYTDMLQETIRVKFLAGLESIDANEEDKSKLKQFFEGNIDSFELLRSYSMFLNTYYTEIKNKIGSYENL